MSRHAIFRPYLIFGINIFFAASPVTALKTGLYPLGRLSFLGPVFSCDNVGLLGEVLLLCAFLLMRTIDKLLLTNAGSIMKNCVFKQVRVSKFKRFVNTL